MRAYIVKTKDGYLYPYQGDVSFTDNQDLAGHFASIDEANDTAEGLGYGDGSYQVIPVSVKVNHLKTN